MRYFIGLLLTTLLFVGCKSPHVENRKTINEIKSIAFGVDSAMVNPMNPTPPSSATVLKSDLTLLLGNRKLKVSQAQFDEVIEDIKYVDMSKLKGKKYKEPLLGSSYKSIQIETSEKLYEFTDDNYNEYPLLISQLVSKFHRLIATKLENHNDNKWHKLKLLKAYSPTDFNLKKGVEYLEIRSYFRGVKERNYNLETYNTPVVMQRKPLNSFDAKLVKTFKNIKPNLSKETNLKKSGFCLMSGCASKIANGFMIDSYNKIWVMNTTEDILNMLGEIDTPAEVKLVLWLHSKSMTESEDIYRYKKKSNGYKVTHEYDNHISNLGECGHFMYEMFVSRFGKISDKKLLKKSQSKHGCLAVD